MGLAVVDLPRKRLPGGGIRGPKGFVCKGLYRSRKEIFYDLCYFCTFYGGLVEMGWSGCLTWARCLGLAVVTYKIGTDWFVRLGRCRCSVWKSRWGIPVF